MYMLLLALPKSYETVITFLENQPIENLSTDFIKAKLRTGAETKKKISRSQDEMVKLCLYLRSH